MALHLTGSSQPSVLDELEEEVDRHCHLLSILKTENIIHIIEYLPKHGSDRWVIKQTCKKMNILMQNNRLDKRKLNIRQPITQPLSTIYHDLPKTMHKFMLQLRDINKNIVATKPYDDTIRNDDLAFGLQTQLFLHALERRDFESVRWLLSNVNHHLVDISLVPIVRLGSLELLQWAHHYMTTALGETDKPIRGCKCIPSPFPLDGLLLKTAICGSNDDVIGWLLDQGHVVTRDHFNDAILLGNESLIRRFHDEYHFNMNLSAVAAAVRHGSEETLQWLEAEFTCLYDPMELLKLILLRRSIPVLNWFLKKNPTAVSTEGMGVYALTHTLTFPPDSEDLLTWMQVLRERKCPMNAATLSAAISVASFPVVSWMVNTLNIPLTDGNCNYILQQLDIDFVKLVFEKCPRFQQEPCIREVFLNPNPPVWEHVVNSNFIQLVEETTRVAVCADNVPLLKWLVAVKQCPFNLMFHEYIPKMSIEMLECLYDGFNLPITQTAMIISILFDRVDVVKWLIEHGHQYDVTTWRIARFITKHQPMISLLKEKNCPGSNSWNQKIFDWFPWAFNITIDEEALNTCRQLNPNIP